MRPISVLGLGLWTPGFAGVTAWREGRPDPAIDKPACRLIDARLKRGTSLFANMLGEVVEQAATDAGLDVAKVPTVYGSRLGEIETMAVLLRMLFEEDGKLSPVRFKNSVHNAASGLVSIATQNTAFTTAIAAGERSFEASLLEAWALLEREGGHAIVAVADDRPPVPLRELGDHGALAIAIALGTESAPRARARLSGLRQRVALPVSARVPDELAGNCASAALALVAAVVEGRAGTVPIALPGRPGGAVDVHVPA
ncbi:MAG: beta-ketoacyl synthase chain length factor [Sandaracinaceae bacterium]|nr:beta-ketoacyl synthase chain length factor [Sandaracinaceae bacterium]